MKKHFGLIGKNIDYSFSRHYFLSKFRKECLSGYSYINFDLPQIDAFEKVLKNTPYLAGLNVTIPYKKDVIPFLDKISLEAKSIDAVNTIVWDVNGKTTGQKEGGAAGLSACLPARLSYLPICLSLSCMSCAIAAHSSGG